MRMRSIIALLASAVLLLAGCGGSKSAAPTNETATPKAETRIVHHAMGDTPITGTPQRVVVLDTGELDSVIALGIKPVGAVTVYADGTFPKYLADEAAGAQKVGTIAQPNLEAIAALKPDLILSSKLRHKDLYEKLSQIAPTVFAENVGVTWKENFKLYAEALGKSAEAAKLLADYDKRNEEFKAKLGAQAGKLQVSIARGLADHTRIYMKQTFIHTILTDAGLARPAVQDKDVFMEKATDERIPDLDGDVMFITHFRAADGGQTHLEKLMQSPLWQELKVVKAGKVYEVSDDHWMLGIGIRAASLVQADLAKYLLK